MLDELLIKEKLKKKLSPRRYEHSIGVAYTAAAMAMVYDVNIKAAKYAGLLHDYGKCLSDEDKIKKCKKYGLHISSAESKNPELLHAKLGAYYAKNNFKITNEDILSAIAYHTTGRPNMSILEKIIFIADYIEPNRKPLKDIDIIRKEAFTDMNQCIEHILSNTISYLERNDMVIDNISKETYEYYK